ncbi:MAG: hypothetical protein JNJ58_08595 [Chitinophagaceae bacterium]|nr:hypothetical protein [Chitinophagaceae bacterium]
MKFLQLLLIVFLGMLLHSCKGRKNYDGDSVVNYPDMKMVFEENLKSYEQDPYTYKLIQSDGSEKDTSYLKAKDVKWKDLKKQFLEANLYRKELDKHYKIDIFHDTLYGTLTMLLTALDPDAYTSSFSLKARSSDNKIISVYIEARDAGFFSTTEYKLLFVNGRTLQVQESIKRLFGSRKERLTKLVFLNEE